VHKQALNVGRSEEIYRIKEIAEVVRKTVPGCKIEYAKDGAPDLCCYRASFAMIMKTLPGFKPQWNVRRRAEQLYEVYKKTRLKLGDFEGPKYKRIDHVNILLAWTRLGSDLRWKALVQSVPV
jgi:hypothetical protein